MSYSLTAGTKASSPISSWVLWSSRDQRVCGSILQSMCLNAPRTKLSPETVTHDVSLLENCVCECVPLVSKQV